MPWLGENRGRFLQRERGHGDHPSLIKAHLGAETASGGSGTVETSKLRENVGVLATIIPHVACKIEPILSNLVAWVILQHSHWGIENRVHMGVGCDLSGRCEPDSTTRRRIWRSCGISRSMGCAKSRVAAVSFRCAISEDYLAQVLGI